MGSLRIAQPLETPCGGPMRKVPQLCMIALVWSIGGMAIAGDKPPWPAMLPIYDHIVVVVEENKDFEQILGGRFDAPYIRNWQQKERPSSACSPRSILAK